MHMLFAASTPYKKCSAIYWQNTLIKRKRYDTTDFSYSICIMKYLVIAVICAIATAASAAAQAGGQTGTQYLGAQDDGQKKKPCAERTSQECVHPCTASVEPALDPKDSSKIIRKF